MAKRKRKRIVHSNGTESGLERKFLEQWLFRFPKYQPITQLQFHPKRKWTFDFAWPTRKVAVEVQGMGPGHCSLVGMTQDYDKNLAAHIHGWRIVYVTTIHLSPGRVDAVCRNIAVLLNIPLPPVPVTTRYVPLKRRQ